LDNKVAQLLVRLDEIEEALAKPGAYDDPKKYRELTQEHNALSKLRTLWDELVKQRKQLQDDHALLESESDLEMRALLADEVPVLAQKVAELESALETLLVPPDPNDSRNIIVEMRAGTGGDEAALFVGDCVRMYHLFADAMGWKYETLSCSPSEVGGFKEYIMALSGSNVRRFLQYEAGTHRVQRVPETETQGRIHTSAITIAVLLEPTEDEEIELDEKDLRIDTYRSSGAGGQHVNTTDSAVRITHIPTGTVTYCQDERSQHKNKDKAMRLLKAKIAEVQRQKKQEEEASLRASQVGSGDRSERIRTYNFPQNRLTDHRINLTLYNLDRIMEGELQEVTSSLVKFYYQQKLAA
jgi:peptide chain release factor 1